LRIDIKPKHEDDDLYDDDTDDDSTRITAKTQSYNVPKKSGTLELKPEFSVYGFVEICVIANKKMTRPVYVSLQVIETGAVKENEFFDDDYMAMLDQNIEHEEEKAKKLSGVKAEETENQVKGHAHLNYVEKTVFNMLREASFLQNNVEAQKKAEAKYFHKSKAMHLSSKRWPVIHLLVLIVTGFLQAKHMMNFFKSRRVM